MIWLSTALVACTGLTDISEDYVVITPDVAAIDAWVAGGVLVVELTLSDPSIAFPESARIPLAASSSAGDQEQVLARRMICEDSKWGFFVCGQVIIGSSANDVGALASRLRDHDAFIVHGLNGGADVVAYFPYGSLQDIIAVVRKWPETRWVEPNGLVPTGAVPKPSQVVIVGPIRGFIAIENAEVVRGNRFLEAAPSQSLVVQYPADGSPELVKRLSNQ